MERIVALRTWTDIVRDRSVALIGTPPQPEMYRELIVSVNRALFGQPHFKCDRDNMTPDQQRVITSFETMLSVFADRFPDDHPSELVDRAIRAWTGQG